MNGRELGIDYKLTDGEKVALGLLCIFRAINALVGHRVEVRRAGERKADPPRRRVKPIRFHNRWPA